MRSVRFALIACAVTLWPLAAARAQEAPPTGEETVVVTAPSQQAIMDAARAFVGEVSREAGSTDQIGRWDGTICPAAIGMRAEHAELLLDRVAAVAYSVGLNVGEPGCDANILIFVTADSDAFARHVVDAQQEWVTPRGAGCFAYTEAVGDFVETARPIRWWHVSYAINRYGALAERRCNDEDAAPVVEGNLGRISRGTRQQLGRALVIVDARRIAGQDFAALADYIAMVSLASMDLRADTSGFDTILNLFGEGASARPAHLTDWDVAYLEGLYSARRDVSGRSQRDQISRSVARGVTDRPAPGDANPGRPPRP